MGNEEKIVSINFNNFQEEGLYLILEGERNFILNKNKVEQEAVSFWKDPDRLPANIKVAGEFQRCENCPLVDEGGLCNAIRPVIPFIAELDKYSSYDKVVAIYKERGKGLLHLSNTTMQLALKYVFNLSLLNYCEGMRKYRRYYLGIIPLDDLRGIAQRFYLNAYWIHKGDKNVLDNLINVFRDEMILAAKNQLKRLALICKNDAFLNALVSTQLIGEMLTMKIEDKLKQSFDSYEKDFF